MKYLRVTLTEKAVEHLKRPRVVEFEAAQFFDRYDPKRTATSTLTCSAAMIEAVELVDEHQAREAEVAQEPTPAPE